MITPTACLDFGWSIQLFLARQLQEQSVVRFHYKQSLRLVALTLVDSSIAQKIVFSKLFCQIY